MILLRRPQARGLRRRMKNIKNETPQTQTCRGKNCERKIRISDLGSLVFALRRRNSRRGFVSLGVSRPTFFGQIPISYTYMKGPKMHLLAFLDFGTFCLSLQNIFHRAKKDENIVYVNLKDLDYFLTCKAIRRKNKIWKKAKN